MRSLIPLFIILLCFSEKAFSLSCEPGWSSETAFNKAKHFMVIRVVSVTLEEELAKKMPGYSTDSEIPIILNSYQYRLVENLKGQVESVPKIYSAINTGAGGANLVPGAYYLLSVPEESLEFENELYHFITYCEVHSVDISTETENFKKEVKKVKDFANKKGT
jgi:hypothetical protein